ncbi:unnamed protein product [Bursaphelenchus xylophilus]|uniref:(pine wood nematode) hypothetical protein n=1 Tax=Bursaphelenchus xylophilus TaxID=6326 RepID=A0A1I7S253_BURXY|nr:unnamed protein product [Bursaphelenchus xylophilus]CAG9114901.1 unnamed protein product [Bursaphelenchus xylophilus]
MAPPTFADLGKAARDVFGKGYNHGLVKLDTTTRGNDNGTVEFKTSATHNLTSEQLAGTVDIKFKVPERGVTITEKLNTSGSLSTVLEVNDQFARNLKVTLDSVYVPNTGKRDATLKSEWFNDAARVNINLGLIGGPVALVSGVVGQNGWLAGAQGRFDVSTNELKNTSVAFGYQHPNYTIHSFCNDGKEFGGSLYHRVHKNVELGAQLGWTNGEEKVRYALGSTYKINPDLLLRAKVDNKAVVGLAATHALGPNVKASISTQFGLTTANSQNKLGVGIEYTP